MAIKRDKRGVYGGEIIGWSEKRGSPSLRFLPGIPRSNSIQEGISGE